jgi:uncharacterized protein (DUF433 family)
MRSMGTNKQTATYRDRIIRDPEILVGKPVIKGTRISVDLVLEYLAQTPDLDELFADYPELSREDVQAVLAYAREAVGRQKRPAKLLRAATRAAPV